MGHPEYQSAYRTRCDTSDNVCLMTALFYIYYVAKKTSIDLILNLLYIHPLYRKLVYLYFFSQPCEAADQNKST
jgi:formate hydrogenlyase subunit 4